LSGLVVEMIQATGDIGTQWILDLCNGIVKEGSIPEDWKSSVVLPKLTNRPGFSGTVPVWDTLSRNPERCLRDTQMSWFSSRRPGRDRNQST